MTMNLKKVFTSTSFNLSSVFYARFCAGSFYQSSTNVELSYYIKYFKKIYNIIHMELEKEERCEASCGFFFEKKRKSGT